MNDKVKQILREAVQNKVQTLHREVDKLVVHTRAVNLEEAKYKVVVLYCYMVHGRGKRRQRRATLRTVQFFIPGLKKGAE